MINNTAQTGLIGRLLELLEAHRPAFKQERPFWRAIGLVFGELFSFGRHTVTQELMALGMTEEDWGHGIGCSAESDMRRRNYRIACWKRRWSMWEQMSHTAQPSIAPRSIAAV